MRQRRVAGVLLALALVVAACSGDDGAADETTTTTTQGGTDTTQGGTDTTQGGTDTTTTTPPAGPTGTLTVALPTFGKEVFDPSIGTSLEKSIYGPMYDFFVGLTQDGEPDADGGALESWEMSPDGMSWTLTLHEGMTWHDGSPITSADIKFSLERYAEDTASCSRCVALQEILGEVSIVDELTAVANFSSPNPALLGDLTAAQGDIPILPKDYYESVGTDGFNAAPIGSGPFKFVTHSVGEEIVYEANLDYWNQSRLPGYEQLVIKLAPEALSRLALVERGEVDLALMEPQNVEEIRAAGLQVGGPKAIQTVVAALAHSWNPEFETNLEEFRKALILAIDKEAILASIYPEGTATPAASLINVPTHLGYDPELEPRPYDPDEARSIIEANGWQGTQVTLYSWTTWTNIPELPILMQAIGGYLEAVGLDPVVEPVDYTAIRPNLLMLEGNTLTDPNPIHGWFVTSTGAFETLVRIGLLAQADGGLYGAYHDAPEVLRLYNAISSDTDPDSRDELARELNRLVYDTWSVLPIAVTDSIWAIGPDVAEWRPTNFTPSDYRFETARPAG
jgi:peptide/nickel transport system substrate-binding protein